MFPDASFLIFKYTVYDSLLESYQKKFYEIDRKSKT